MLPHPPTGCPFPPPAQQDDAQDLSARYLSLAESGGEVTFSGGFQSGHFTDVWDLYAGQKTDIGDVESWVSGDSLYVRYVIAEPGWTVLETHLAVGSVLSDIPQTKNGNPIPGQFPKYPMAGELLYEVPLPSPLPDTLYIAAHAELVYGEQEESAWAGTLEFPGANWATYVAYSKTQVAGSGVWLATDYEWSANTFDPDPVGFPTLDLDDKLILQRQGGNGEGAYDLPAVPPVPGNNFRIWWDRDGMDPWQNAETANTGGFYQVVITLHATSDATGTAYMNIRGLDQGFETDGNWNTIELTPAGLNFVGDMRNLMLFYGLNGYGATHSVTFSEISVTT